MTEQNNQAAQVIAARLRACREAKGWTMATAAERLSEATGENVIHQRWARWEHGDRVPSPELAAPLAAMFGTDPDYFSVPTE